MPPKKPIPPPAADAAATAAAPPQPPGAGLSQVQRALRKLGLVRDIDFALYLPMRYEDETRIVRLADTRDGDLAQVEGVVTECEVVYRPRRQLIATIDDGSDTCQLRFFNFYPSQQKQLAVGARVRVRGEMRGGFVGRQIMHPTVKAAGTALPNALTPVYSTVAGLAQPVLRREVRSGLARAVLDETVPVQIGFRGAWDLRASLSFLHYPTPDVAMATLEDHSHPAWQRIKAEELLAQQLSQLQARLERAAQRAPVLPSPAEPLASSLHAQLLAVLPFGLTGAQQRVGEEITRDLCREIPMHRLLQGDVGSGKTVVAALAAARAIDAGFQCALMAPTEILAAQHFGKLVGWLDPLLAERGLRVAWLTGSQKKKERDEMSAAVESGEAALVIGTHAVISEKVRFKNLALAIIDEQHRFGVAQRLALRGKAVGELEPHLLMMSATPIPRTLAMSYYADLDVSTLDELPPGRTPIVTKLVADHRRDEVIDRIHAQIAQGRQVYWVCPLIEESEAVDLRNATETRDELTGTLGEPIQVGLLHSRMPTAEKQAVTGEHHRDRSGRGRAQCLADGDRACRALRPLAAAPAARPGGARRGGVGLRAALCAGRQRARGRGRARPAQGDGRNRRRLRDRAARPGDSRTGRVPGRAPVGRAAAALCRPHDRHAAARLGARARAGDAAEAPRPGPAPHRPLARHQGRVPQGLRGLSLQAGA